LGVHSRRVPQTDSTQGNLLRAVESLAEAFEVRSARYALIGGVASVHHGVSQLTRHVEFLIEVPETALPELLDDLMKQGFTLDPAVVITRYVEEHFASFMFGGVRVDWLRPIIPVYSRTIHTAAPGEWTPGHSVRVATAESLILTKMVAFRLQDQMDIETLLTANRDTIDVSLIREEWAFFAATQPERTTWLESVIAKRVVRRE
jgi:hypothetical protein